MYYNSPLGLDCARPGYLYLLGLVPLGVSFLGWAASQRRAVLDRLGTPSTIAAPSASVSRRERRWKAMLWFVALIAIVLVLAWPLWSTQVTIKAQEGVDVMVVLAEGVKPNRLTRAKLTVEELMDLLGGNDVGLVIFSGAAIVQFPLSASNVLLMRCG